MLISLAELPPPARSTSHELVGLVRRLSLAHTIEEVMAAVTASARSLLGADGVSFVLRDGDLCYYAEENAVSPLWKGQRFPMSACISGWTMLHKTPALIEDIYQDARIPHGAYLPTFVKSLAMAPVRAEEPVAAIGAYWSTRHRTSPDERELLEAIADASALAIANVDLQAAHQGLGRAHDQLAVLLREVNHRVKNNLQMVASMIGSVARQGPPESKPLLHDIRRRISTIGQAYNQTCATGDLRKHDLGEYLRAVCEQAIAAQAGDAIHLRLQLEPIIVDTGIALPVGLIAGELITNAIKHAFPAGSTGEVTVRLDRMGEYGILTVRDSGIGLASAQSPSSLGLKLVETLTRQVGGRLYATNRTAGGAQFRLVFRLARRKAAA